MPCEDIGKECQREDSNAKTEAEAAVIHLQAMMSGIARLYQELGGRPLAASTRNQQQRHLDFRH